MTKIITMRTSLKLAITSFIILLCTQVTNGQSGRISVVGDVAVSQLVEKHRELNYQTKTQPGYRIQIASFSGSNSRGSAFSLKERFMKDYEGTQAYIIYEEPNFKVKVGDFRTRLEAFAFLQRIKDTYKGYIIKDDINTEPPTIEVFFPDEDGSGDE